MRTAGRSLVPTIVFASLLVGCTAEVPAFHDESDAPLTSSERETLARQIRAQFTARGIRPIPTKAIPGTSTRQAALVKLGQALMFDKVLSDNRDVSCMTCHPPAVGTDDDRHLSAGVGGVGLGASRSGGVDIARNAPPLFNLHALDAMFWDGRVERLPDGTYRTPAGAQLTPAMTAVFEFGALSALSMFPVTNRDEMREHVLDGNGDDLTALADDDFTGTWEALMKRLRAIPAYRTMFADAYPNWPGDRNTRIDTMTFAHASNAMAAFMVAKFTSNDSPWDDFVRGNNYAFRVIETVSADMGRPISEREVLLGAKRFMETCANCHDGPLLSNNRFHNTALAQLGPGLGDGDEDSDVRIDDFGRARITTDPAAGRCGLPGSNASCRYAFRTSPLRNVLFTAPYGHAGQIGHFGNAADFGDDVRDDLEDLRAFVAHYAVDPAERLRQYRADQVDPRLRSTIVGNIDAVIAHIDPLFATGSPVTDADVDVLTAFMVAQTSKALFGSGTTSTTGARFALCGVIPASVPSGLPLDADATDEDDCISDGDDDDDLGDD